MVGALLTGSLALLADAGHNFSDVLGLAIAWGGAALARRAACELEDGTGIPSTSVAAPEPSAGAPCATAACSSVARSVSIFCRN